MTARRKTSARVNSTERELPMVALIKVTLHRPRDERIMARLIGVHGRARGRLQKDLILMGLEAERRGARVERGPLEDRVVLPISEPAAAARSDAPAAQGPRLKFGASFMRQC